MKPNGIMAGLFVGTLASFTGATYAIEYEGFAMQALHEALIAAEISENAGENVGKQDQALWVANHAQQALIALTGAQMTEEVKSDRHVRAAEQALNEAIKRGNMGHPDLAAQSAEEALEHLDIAYKEQMPG